LGVYLQVKTLCKTKTKSMNDKTKMEANESSTEMKAMATFKEDFESVYNIISTHRNRVIKQINGETLMMA